MIQIPCKELPDGRLQFKCLWCNKTHTHGVGYGGRQSHCPNYDGEYELIPMEEEK